MEIFIIASLVLACILVAFIVLYIHYQKTSIIKSVPGTETHINVPVKIRQQATGDWSANAYEHTGGYLSERYDEELECNIPSWLMREDITKHLNNTKFICKRVYEEYDSVVEIWVKGYDSIRLQYSKTYEDFSNWEPEEGNEFYLYQLQVESKNPKVLAEKLMKLFATTFREAVREKQKVTESTSVYEFVVNPFDGTYNLRRRSTQQLFKYGRVLTECPEMFKHIAWEFDGEKQENFDGEAVAKLIEYCATNSPRVNGGILFGAPGTGKTSFLNALAFVLGKNSALKVIMVSGPTMTDPIKMTALATRLADEKEKGNNPVIMINEGDSLMRVDERGKKTSISEILMNLMDLYPCYISCNCFKDEIHEAFYREGRGSFLFYVGNLTQAQIEPVNTYIKKVADEEESLVFIQKQVTSPTLAQLFSQLKPTGWEEFKAKLKEGFSSVKVKDTVEPAISQKIQSVVTKNNLQKFRSRNRK